MKKTKTTKRTEPAAVNQSAWPEISKERDRELRRIAELKVRATDEDFDPVLHELGQAITAGTATAKDRDKFTRLLNARWKKPTTTYVAELNSEFEAERVQRHVAVIIGNRNAEAARKIAAERDRMAAVNMDSVLSAISGKNVPVYQATPNADVLKSIEQMREQISAALETHKKSELMQGPADDFIFRQDGGPGGFWTIRYDGTDLPHVPASKGMMQIHRLLSKRMDPVPARELYHIPNHVHPDALNDNSEALADTHGTEWSREYVYDDPGAARKAMQGRLDDIEAELAEQSTPSVAKSPAQVLETRDELRVEQAKLTKAIREISATIRTGGPQLARDDKRTAVKGTIDRAITMIGKTTRCDELARHLANMIETGTTCIYKGDHDWLTE